MTIQLWYLDANVFIHAFRGTAEFAPIAEAAMNPAENRVHLASELQRMELFVLPFRRKRHEGLDFLHGYFRSVNGWIHPAEEVFRKAWGLSTQVEGLRMADALHASLALSVGATFVTAEKPGRPFFSVPGLRILSVTDDKFYIGSNS